MAERARMWSTRGVMLLLSLELMVALFTSVGCTPLVVTLLTVVIVNHELVKCAIMTLPRDIQCVAHLQYPGGDTAP